MKKTLLACLVGAAAITATAQSKVTVFEGARQRGGLPSPEAVAAARAAVGWSGLTVSAQAIRLQRPGMAVTPFTKSTGPANSRRPASRASSSGSGARV